MHRILLIASLFYLSSIPAWSQKIPIDETSSSHMLSPIGAAFNRIFNGRDMDSFYIKLANLRKKKTGVVRIVHIGDSHVQAGFFPGYVRENLQQVFGNAGRGLVFPYDGIQTTSPADINSSANAGWSMGRVIGPAVPLAGVSGYGIQTRSVGSQIDIGISGQGSSDNFRTLKFFINNPSSWILRCNNNEASYFVKNTDPGKPLVSEVRLENSSSHFSLSSLPSSSPQSFFGVSLENEQPGILYHAIGVNGARFDQYNLASTFWQQLSGLQADLYIVSLGTNDAQRSFTESVFRKQLALFIQKLKATAPRAIILFTTAADSYKGGRPNIELRSLNLSLFEYCTANSIPVWDLYRVTNGHGSAYNWLSRGMMNPDLVHFTPGGYQLQGQLLFNALIKGFNDYWGY